MRACQNSFAGYSFNRGGGYKPSPQKCLLFTAALRLQNLLGVLFLNKYF
uniref:Uncharacterized protein n=1 Tax=Anguilla anguilla TaxID=7936 RepID=A0A0E9W741_ANGAN